MYTAYSACPTTENPPCVPGTYRVLVPDPVTPVAFRSKLSEATAKARAARATTCEQRYNANENR